MDAFKTSQNTSQKYSQSAQHNPFARALAEVEKKAKEENLSIGQQDQKQSKLTQPNSLFDASQLQKSGEQTIDPLNFTNSRFNQEKQAELLKKKQMREKLHRMINPVEQSDVFSAREEQVKKRINEIRVELKKLAEEIAGFYKDVDIALTQDVRSTGLTGAYHENFFEKLREFIIMLRQRVSSARTWARQAKAKQRKKSRKYGLDFAGNEAKAVHDSFHHERNASFGA